MNGDKSMQYWQPGLDRTHGPLYLAIADAIGRAIAAKELRPGERLPPQRRLATALEVDLTTVTRGYTEAQRRGLVEAVVGRGTFVRGAERTPHTADGVLPLVDMSMNPPPQSLDPLLQDALREGLEAVLRQTDIASLMGYHLGGGSPWAREAGAAWVRPMLASALPAHTLVCNGAQAALTALLTLLTRPGDVVLAEPLTYQRFRALAAHLGVRIHAVATDADGMLPDALDAACLSLTPKAIYCIPTIQNPTTVTMSLPRRQAIAEVVLRHGVAVIEDDAYGRLIGEPVTALAALAPSQTWYLATLSKCLSPGLRLAYVVAPDRAAAARLEGAVRATALMPPTLMTVLVSGWIHQGTAAALCDGVRREIVARQAIAREILPAGNFVAHPEGPHVWLTLPPQWHRMAFTAHVRGLGLALAPSDAFLVEGAAPNAVRIGLGAAESQAALRTALQAVTTALRAEAPPDLADIV
jgi:DNA-binding transcriptional MocR family regulator